MTVGKTLSSTGSGLKIFDYCKIVNSIKNLISNSYILDRRRIKKKLKSVRYKNFEVRLAKNFNDIDAAQNLRYRVFYEELKAKPTIKNILYEKSTLHFLAIFIYV